MALTAATPGALRAAGLRAAGLAAILLLVGGCSGGTGNGSTSPDTVSPTASAASAAPEGGTQSTATEQPDTAGTPKPTASSPGTSAGDAPDPQKLHADFPQLLSPIVENSSIEVSTVETTAEVTTVSLVAGTSASQEEVLEHFSELLAEQDFKALGSNSIDGTASQTFSRTNGAESVTVSAVENGDETTYTLGAHLLPASVK